MLDANRGFSPAVGQRLIWTNPCTQILRLAAVKFDQSRATDPDPEFEEQSKYYFIVRPSASLIYAVGIATKTATMYELVCTGETCLFRSAPISSLCYINL